MQNNGGGANAFTAKELERAFAESELAVYYQPIVSLSTGGAIGAEALVRWQHPTLGVLLPASFMPAMETHGLVERLDLLVWRQVSVTQQLRRKLGRNELPISVNFSPKTLTSPGVFDKLCSISQEYDTDASQYLIEISESHATSASAALAANVARLREYGFRILLDNFGRSSTLASLKNLPLDTLKIDIGPLSGSIPSAHEGAILSAVLRMAKWLDLTVTATGVETPEQAEFLRSVSCDHVQGFFYSHALPSEDFDAFVLGRPGSSAARAGHASISSEELDMLLGGSPLITRLLSSAFGGIALYELSGENVSLLRVNDGYYEIMGETPATLTPKSDDIILSVHPDDRDAFRRAVSLAADTGREQRLTMRRIRGDGELVYADIILSRIAAAGSSWIICAAFADVTGRMRAEEELRRHSSYLTSLYSSMPCGVVQLKVEGTKLVLGNCNEAALSILACPDKDALRHRLCGPSDDRLVLPPLGKLRRMAIKAAAGECCTFEHSVELSDGRTIWLRSDLRPITLPDGEDVVLSTFFDISAQVEARGFEELKIFTDVLFAEYDEIYVWDMTARTSTHRSSKSGVITAGTASRNLDEALSDWLEHQVRGDHRQRLAELTGQLESACEQKRVVSAEYPVNSSDGDEHWVLSTLLPVTGNRCILCNKDITARKRAELLATENALLRQRTRYAQRQELMNKSAQGLLENMDFHSAINGTLRYALDFYKADRAYIFEFDYDAGISRNTFEQCADGVEPQIERLSSVPLEHTRLWREAFVRDGAFFVSDVTALPDGRPDKAILQMQDISCLMAVPIYHDSLLAGFIGVDNLRDNSDDTLFIHTLGCYISSELIKRRLYDDALTAKTELERTKAEMDSLVNNIPCGLGIFELYDDRISLRYLNDGYYAMQNTVRSDVKPYQEGDFRRAVHPEDLELLYKCAEKMISAKPAELELLLRLRSGSDYKYTNISLRQVSESAGKLTYYAAFTDYDAVHKANLALQDSQEALRKAVDNGGIDAWIYDLESNTFTMNINKNPPFGMPALLENIPHSWIDAKIMLPKYNDAYADMIKKLQEGALEAKLDIEVQPPSAAEPEWRRLVLSRLSDTGHTAIGTAINITEQKLTEQRYEAECSYHDALVGQSRFSMRINITRDELLFLSAAGTSLPPLQQTTDGETVRRIAVGYILDPAEQAQFLSVFDRKNLLSAFERGDTHLSMDFRCRLTDGRTIWERLSLEMTRRPDGDVVAFLVSKDINSEKIADLLIDHAANQDYDFISYIDITRDECFTIVSKNSGAQLPDPYYEHFFDHVCSSRITSCVVPEDRQLALESSQLAHILSAIDEHGVHFYNRTEIQLDGSRARKHLRYSYIDRDQGLLMLTVQDVTAQYERERHEQEALSAALAKAEQANVAKTSFLARISHDLRTPLNAIMGVSELAMKTAPSELRGALNSIRNAGVFLTDIISDVLDVADIEQGSFTLQSEPVLLSELIDGLRDHGQELCKAKGLAFVYRCNLPSVLVRTDRRRLAQVAMNILSNAAKFTSTGGAVSFDVDSSEGEGGSFALQMLITDNGVGISQEFIEHIFEPFSRESNEITTEYQGSGLGLVITRRIVEAMNGVIDISSEKGVGTQVAVTIPLAIAEPLLQPAFDADAALDGKRVLLVEDNPLNAEISTFLFENKHMLVELAKNGQEAVDMFAASPEGYYDAVSMDIRMPIMNGLEAARAMRSLKRGDAASIPIVAVSANAFPKDMNASLAAGMQAHLSKPINSKSMYNTFARLISKHPQKPGDGK